MIDKFICSQEGNILVFGEDSVSRISFIEAVKNKYYSTDPSCSGLKINNNQIIMHPDVTWYSFTEYISTSPLPKSGIIYIISQNTPDSLSTDRENISKIIAEIASAEVPLLLINPFKVNMKTCSEIADIFLLPCNTSIVWYLCVFDLSSMLQLEEVISWLTEKMFKKDSAKTKEICSSIGDPNVLNILILGLEGSGKSTVFNKILGRDLDTANKSENSSDYFECKGLNFKIKLINNQSEIEEILEGYATDSVSIIYVVDSSNRYSLLKDWENLKVIAFNQNFKNLPFVIFFNKFDLGSSLSVTTLTEFLDINNLGFANWFIQPGCGLTGDGLDSCFDWIISKLRKTKERKNFVVVMIGMEDSGKTTFLYNQKLGEIVSTIPTIGYNVENVQINESDLTIWDFGGKPKFRELWSNNSPEEFHGLIYVIDSANPEVLDLNKELLNDFLGKIHQNNIPLLVVANKQDLNEALNISSVTERLDLYSIKDREWFVQKTSVILGEGVFEGLEWLEKQMRGSDNNRKIEEKTEKCHEEVEVKEARILMLGLEKSGKTTILYRIKLGEFVATVPTIGFNVETVPVNKSNLTMWDVGGSSSVRMLWRHYYSGTQGLIYVVDSGNPEELESNREVLKEIHCGLEDKNIPLLVLANKQDLENAVDVQTMTEKLDLGSFEFRSSLIQKTIGTTGEGLTEGLSWLEKQINSSEIKKKEKISKRKKKYIDPFENYKKFKILMIGLDYSGKTTLLYKMKLEKTIESVPTCGFNVESILVEDIVFNIWDVGGQERFRLLWKHYFAEIAAVIFVIDSSSDLFETNSKVLNEVLSESQLSGLPILVYLNKSELESSRRVDEIFNYIKVENPGNNPMFFQECSAYTGDGISEGLRWLKSEVLLREN